MVQAVPEGDEIFHGYSPLLAQAKDDNWKGQPEKASRHKGIKNVMLVTDPGIASLGLHEQLLEWIREEGIECVVYDRTTANPTIANVEEALQLYRENGCHALIAFGGGSPMDCAKGVGARVARPHKKISSMRGELKILKPIPPAHRRAYYGGDGKRDHPGGCADRREDA